MRSLIDKIQFKLQKRQQPQKSGRHPTKDAALEKLKSLDVPVGTILDVGVMTCTGELLHAFRDRHHVLMEPIVEWNDAIKKNYNGAKVSHEILNIAVSDHNGEVKLRTASVHEDKPITHARMTDSKGEGPQFRTVPMQTLDSVVVERDLKRPYLLKIDVDGAELQVLAGAKKTLKSCSVVIIETGFLNMVERAKAVQDAGFQLFDIVDFCYYDDRFVQADMIFLNNKTIHNRGLHVYKHGFDLKKWKSYIPQ